MRIRGTISYKYKKTRGNGARQYSKKNFIRNGNSLCGRRITAQAVNLHFTLIFRCCLHNGNRASAFYLHNGTGFASEISVKLLGIDIKCFKQH